MLDEKPKQVTIKCCYESKETQTCKTVSFEFSADISLEAIDNFFSILSKITNSFFSLIIYSLSIFTGKSYTKVHTKTKNDEKR